MPVNWERFWMLIAAIMIALVMWAAIPADAAGVKLTATQSLYIEAGPGGVDALGTLFLDLALGPRYRLSYAHDRAWRVDGRHVEHDVSVTRYLANDRTATIGVRIKQPEDDPWETRGYVMFAWRWGG